MGFDPEGEEEKYVTTEGAEKKSAQRKDILSILGI
jgi:hypothetical protein